MRSAAGVAETAAAVVTLERVDHLPLHLFHPLHDELRVHTEPDRERLADRDDRLLSVCR